MIPSVIILSLLRRQFVTLGQCSLLRLGVIREVCLFLTSIYSTFLLNASDASLFLILPFRLAPFRVCSDHRVWLRCPLAPFALSAKVCMLVLCVRFPVVGLVVSVM
jgi:hypothetical protein